MSGCLRAFFTFLPLQVPGNFHVSTHSATAQPQNPDMTHIIHKLAFGDKLQVTPSSSVEFSFSRMCQRWNSCLIYLFINYNNSMHFVLQVQNVQGAFNALGGANRLESNGMLRTSWV